MTIPTIAPLTDAELKEIGQVLRGASAGWANLPVRALYVQAFQPDRAMRLLSDLTATKAELGRARETLRDFQVEESTINRVGFCFVCEGEWEHGHPETHLSVTINGVTGPCPAQKEGI